MTMLKEMPAPSSYDCLWPRHVLIDRTVVLARENRHAESALLDAIAQGTRDPFVWRNVCESWDALIAWVAMNANLSRQDTLDWLLCAGLCKVSDQRKSFASDQKEALFSCLAARARELEPKKTGIAELMGSLPQTAGSPFVLI